MTEVSIGCGRRADIMGIDPVGRITIVEIKISLADLRGDRKWREYLGYCDRYFWAVPAGFDLSPFAGSDFSPDITGLLVGDRFDAEAVRMAPWHPLSAAVAPARRKAETLAFARRAALRLVAINDPEAGYEGGR